MGKEIINKVDLHGCKAEGASALGVVSGSIRDAKMELRAAIDDFLHQFNPTSARRLMDAQDAMKVARKRAAENAEVDQH